jgi:hypothetical protein
VLVDNIEPVRGGQGRQVAGYEVLGDRTVQEQVARCPPGGWVALGHQDPGVNGQLLQDVGGRPGALGEHHACGADGVEDPGRGHQVNPPAGRSREVERNRGEDVQKRVNLGVEQLRPLGTLRSAVRPGQNQRRTRS